MVSAPTGISWSTIPPGQGVTPAQRYAEQLNICARATTQADQYCNQILRATTDVETLHGPDYRATVQTGSGLGRLILQRWPILDVVSVQVSPNTFPRSWTTVPSGYYAPEVPVVGLYGSVAPSSAGEGGQAILVQQGYLNWALGRNGYVIQIQYVNGWPHCSLTANASAGAGSVTVDDCTGWALTGAASSQAGATGTVYDTGGLQETVQVTASSVTSGPGTLTLASDLQYAHEAGTLVSTLPASVQWAVILFGTAQALTRGATSTTIHQIPGGSGGAGAKGPEDITGEGELLLHPYRRTI